VSYLLDTNVVSELRKGGRANPGVLEWFAGIGDSPLYLSVLVIGELRRGIELVRRRDEASATALDHWLRQLLAQHGDRVLPVDLPVTEAWAHLSVPDPIPVIDGLLARVMFVL